MGVRKIGNSNISLELKTISLFFIFNFSPTKGAGVFSSLQSKVSGWVPSMPTVSMPAMPNVSLPNVGLPNIPNIPGLKKNSTSTEADGAVEAAENLENATGGGDDDEDRSRYIRYVGLANK